MIRLYGASVGNGSFCRVAAGMRHGLSEMGKLDGFVPVDAYDEETIYPGHDAPVGVFVGPLDRVAMMTGIGWHKQRFVLLPANSTWVPEGLVRGLEKLVTGFLAPSEWAANILRGYTRLPVILWRHGVSSAFRPDALDRLALVKDYDRGDFRVGHLASTVMQRKGTRELVRAWCRAVREGAIGMYPMLTLIVDGPSDAFEKDVAEIAPGDLRVASSITWSRRRWNMDDVQAAHWYRKHHLIAQPSRGEGFGLVPLEARACGVPVMMTCVTGHGEQIHGWMEGGFEPIPCRSMAPLDDGPGAMAPALAEEDVLKSLVSAYERWKSLLDDVQAVSKVIHEHWNWTAVSKYPLKEIMKCF